MKKEIKFEIKVNGQLLLASTKKPGLFAYKRTIKTNVGKQTSTQGLVFKKDVPKLTVTETAITSSEWAIVPLKLLESIAKNGFCDKENDFKHLDLISKNPYDDVNKKSYRLIRVDISSHMIFDEKDKPLPAAIYFDYMNGYIKHSHYNLSKVYEILSKKPSIKFLVNKELIPYYNNDSGNEMQSSFIWSPSVQEYRKMWAQCFKYSRRYPSCEIYVAIFDLDLLKLRKGGAALFDDYYKSTPSLLEIG